MAIRSKREEGEKGNVSETGREKEKETERGERKFEKGREKG
jgi:hypothetical protein